MGRMQTGTARAHLLAGRFDTAVSWSEKAYRDLLSFLLAVGIVAASHALAGRTDEAQQAVHHLRQLDPTLRISNLKDRVLLHRLEDLATLEEDRKSTRLNSSH